MFAEIWNRYERARAGRARGNNSLGRSERSSFNWCRRSTLSLLTIGPNPPAGAQHQHGGRATATPRRSAPIHSPTAGFFSFSLAAELCRQHRQLLGPPSSAGLDRRSSCPSPSRTLTSSILSDDALWRAGIARLQGRLKTSLVDGFDAFDILDHVAERVPA